MSADELKAAVRRESLLARLIRARSMIGKMCSELRPPKMSIPVDYDDEDFFICLTLKDAAAEIERLNSLLSAEKPNA